MTITELIKQLEGRATGLELDAEAFDAIAKHFRPRFEACWQDGKMVDQDLALRLRPFVLDNEGFAREYRRQTTELREAVENLKTIILTASEAISSRSPETIKQT